MQLACALSLAIVAACATGPRPTVEPAAPARPPRPARVEPTSFELVAGEIPYTEYGVRFGPEEPTTDCGAPVRATPRTFESVLVNSSYEACTQRVSGTRKLTTLIEHVLHARRVAVIDVRGRYLTPLSTTADAVYHRLVELGLPEDRIRIQAKVGPDEESLVRVFSR